MRQSCHISGSQTVIIEASNHIGSIDRKVGIGRRAVEVVLESELLVEVDAIEVSQVDT